MHFSIKYLILIIFIAATTLFATAQDNDSIAWTPTKTPWYKKVFKRGGGDATDYTGKSKKEVKYIKQEKKFKKQEQRFLKRMDRRYGLTPDDIKLKGQVESADYVPGYVRHKYNKVIRKIETRKKKTEHFYKKRQQMIQTEDTRKRMKKLEKDAAKKRKQNKYR